MCRGALLCRTAQRERDFAASGSKRSRVTTCLRSLPRLCAIRPQELLVAVSKLTSPAPGACGRQSPGSSDREHCCRSHRDCPRKCSSRDREVIDIDAPEPERQGGLYVYIGDRLVSAQPIADAKDGDAARRIPSGTVLLYQVAIPVDADAEIEETALDTVPAGLVPSHAIVVSQDLYAPATNVWDTFVPHCNVLEHVAVVAVSPNPKETGR